MFWTCTWYYHKGCSKKKWGMSQAWTFWPPPPQIEIGDAPPPPKLNAFQFGRRAMSTVAIGGGGRQKKFQPVTLPSIFFWNNPNIGTVFWNISEPVFIFLYFMQFYKYFHLKTYWNGYKMDKPFSDSNVLQQVMYKMEKKKFSKFE